MLAVPACRTDGLWCAKIATEAIAAWTSAQGIISLRATPGANGCVSFSRPGCPYPNMGRGLYESEPLIRTVFDEGAELLQRNRGIDIRAVLFGSAPADRLRQQLNQTAMAQPALFLIEYALARLWMAWGVTPRAMVGHSIGEYVAACLAGVFSLKDALALVADRGKFMQQAAARSDACRVFGCGGSQAIIDASGAEQPAQPGRGERSSTGGRGGS